MNTNKTKETIKELSISELRPFKGNVIKLRTC